MFHNPHPFDTAGSARSGRVKRVWVMVQTEAHNQSSDGLFESTPGSFSGEKPGPNSKGAVLLNTG